MRDLLQRDDLDIKTEDSTFTALVRWLEYDDGTDRKTTYKHSLLSLLRFPVMDTRFLAAIVAPHPIMQEPALQQLVLEAYQFQLIGEEIENRADSTTKFKFHKRDTTTAWRFDSLIAAKDHVKLSDNNEETLEINS